MKMVKSLLLGSAAGLVAVAGAQAADLPVKAKPVQYVKICSLYGVGFYYIPGTDMCIKIGGWVRAEYGWGTNGSFTAGWMAGNVNNRTTNNSVWRARGYITADARNQTEYGTVRSYIAVGINSNDVGAGSATSLNANRAFIQWAGFTFGLAQSFYDFYSVPATSYWGTFPASDTGDGGWMVAGYTAQFGNGFSGTLAAEMRRTLQIATLGTPGGLAAGTTGFGGTTVLVGYGGFNAPDIVANLRVDQAWGSAAIMGALHEVNMTYYGDATTQPLTGTAGDKWGWVIGAGLKLNTPWLFNWLGSGVGDYFQTQVNYTEGALRYLFNTPNSNWGAAGGDSMGFGILSDAVVGGTLAGTGGLFPTAVELTTAWNVNAAYEHFWSPRWRTSLYGGYAAVTYGGTGNAVLCRSFGTTNGTVVGGVIAAVPGCDNNWQTWWIGSRTQWNVTKDFYMGLDVMYSKLESASLVGGFTTAGVAPGLGTSTPVFITNEDNWGFRFRVHRDFYP